VKNCRAVLPVLIIITLFACALSRPVHGQTDYYNTDRGRPLRTEDAYPVERRAFEIQAAPLRLERFGAGAYSWGFEPEIAYGIAPRTHVEAGVPLAFIDAAGVRRSGVSGLHLSILHNLNVETTIPALAVGANAALPIGSLASDETFFSITGIATRTWSWARFHLNGEYTFGDEPDAGDAGIVEASRWSAGLAADKTFPLKSLLVGAELVAEKPLERGQDTELSAAIGTRYQLTPRWALDAGIGRRVTGDEQSWFITFGSAYAFGLPWRP
jgi:hypothetical protein